LSVSVGAQNTSKKAVVLINGKAFLVDVTPKGNITTTYQRIDNYFSTSESHDLLVDRLSKTAEPTDSKIVFFEKENEPIPSFSEENKVNIDIGTQQYIGFSPERALLQKAGVDQIRKVAKSYRSRRISNINITSYHADNYRSRSLARNRVQAIKDLLHAFGVALSSISTQTLLGNADTKVDFVNISFL